jgi:hypothetical protein
MKEFILKQSLFLFIFENNENKTVTPIDNSFTTVKEVVEKK